MSEPAEGAQEEGQEQEENRSWQSESLTQSNKVGSTS